MEVIVFRHGYALDRNEATRMGLSDQERPLTDEGRRLTRAAAAGLRALLGGDRVDAVATSDLLRAEQTAELLTDYVQAPLLECPALNPAADVHDLDAWLRRRGPRERLILVGHEPGLASWACWSLTRRRDRVLGLKRAGACAIDFPGRAEGGIGTLRWLLMDAQLRSLG